MEFISTMRTSRLINRPTKHLRLKLLEEHRKHLGHLNLLERVGKTPIGPSQEADLASTSVENEALFEIRTREWRTVKEIEYALRKLEEDAYGACENCGKAIARRRLHVLPFVSLCRACKEKEELAARGHHESPVPWENPQEITAPENSVTEALPTCLQRSIENGVLRGRRL